MATTCGNDGKSSCALCCRHCGCHFSLRREQGTSNRTRACSDKSCDHILCSSQHRYHIWGSAGILSCLQEAAKVPPPRIVEHPYRIPHNFDQCATCSGDGSTFYSCKHGNGQSGICPDLHVADQNRIPVMRTSRTRDPFQERCEEVLRHTV